MISIAKRTVLFLAANPSGSNRHALDLEAHSIRAELKRSGYRDRFQLETRWAVQPLDLLRELRELKPAVVHFSGQGSPDGLFFQAPDGRAQIVSPEAIAETFGAAGGSVQLVVLSACYGDAAAEALTAHVDCVVGMSGALHDQAARAFAIGFYGALGDHESVAAAYRHGKAAIRLEGLCEAERPQLKVRHGSDAATLIPAAARPEAHRRPPCPYPGMRPYTADDAHHFYGRGAEIDELIGRLRAGEREICILGPSGSGKSSLVAAGILPRLARAGSGIGPFLVRSMRPGDHPTVRLGELLELSEPARAPADGVAALLAQRAPGASVLIVIDQLEELFTLADPPERERFWLAWRCLRAEPCCTIIFTLRADFHGAFMESPLWHERLSYLGVAPLRGEALCQAIVNPARDVAISLEPNLVERLLTDAGSEPGVLPLLQETLRQLWDRRHSRSLTLADYQAFGEGGRSGLAVALARRADAVLRPLTSAQEIVARRILLRLISFGEGRADTRRQQPRSKLHASGENDLDFDCVLQLLIAARLLTADDDEHRGEACIDLAHEVLIASWPTLAGWIEMHRSEEQRRRQLESAAAEWVKHGRGPRGLLDAIELGDAEAWQRTESARDLGPSADVTALVVASRAMLERQRKRRQSLVAGAFAALGVVAAIVAVLAVMARYRASETQRLLARSYQETGQRLLIDHRPREAMAYLVAARQKGATGDALGMLIGAAIRSLPIIPPLVHQEKLTSAAFSPDGTSIVTASFDGTARVWSAMTGQPLSAPLAHQWIVYSAVFNSDGTRVVTASGDGTARIWDATTGTPLSPPLMHRQAVYDGAFSPDGRRVVTASGDKTAQIWDVATGQALGARLRHQQAVYRAAFSPDGTRVVTASTDGTARVWDAATGKPLTGPLSHLATVWSAAFSPDGTRVVTASSDCTARVWEAKTGLPLSAPFRHQDSVTVAAFSPDGTRVITGSNDGTARIWDAATGRPLTNPLAHRGDVVRAEFSPDGQHVLTASDDETAQVWDAATGLPLGTPFVHQESVTSAAFNSDGTRVVTASRDGIAQVWDAAIDQQVGSIQLAHKGTVRSAEFSPDGTKVVTASDDKTARVWDVATGQPLSVPLVHNAAVRSAAFSPDGARVVTTSDDKTGQVWDAATGIPQGSGLPHWDSVTSVAFSLDGTHVVTVGRDHATRVWDSASGRPLGAAPMENWRSQRLSEWDPMVSAAFSPDGTLVVTTSRMGDMQLWDTTTGKLTFLSWSTTSAIFSADGTRLVIVEPDNSAQVWNAAAGKSQGARLKHEGPVRSAAFSRDSTRVVTASDDKTARVWDAATGEPLGAPLMHQGPVRSAAFSADGSRVVTASEDSTARIWKTPLDNTPWEALVARCPFVVAGDAIKQRMPPALEDAALRSFRIRSLRIR